MSLYHRYSFMSFSLKIALNPAIDCLPIELFAMYLILESTFALCSIKARLQ